MLITKKYHYTKQKEQQGILVKQQKEMFIKMNGPEQLISSGNKIKKKHHQSTNQTQFQVKMNLMNKEIKRMKIYTEELQYRLLTLIKAMGLQENIKKTYSTVSTKEQRKKCLQLHYERQIMEVQLLKFALENLKKDQKNYMIQAVTLTNGTIQTTMTGHEPLFTITNRNRHGYDVSKMFTDRKNKIQYLHKSVQKENRVKMKPVIISDTDSDSDEEEDSQENERYRI